MPLVNSCYPGTHHQEKAVDPLEKLEQARCRLLTVIPFYGHFALGMRWLESAMSDLPEEARTMGVRVMDSGEVECIYHRQFIDGLTVEELAAVIMHECEHVVR
jgi:hypothetical protein